MQRFQSVELDDGFFAPDFPGLLLQIEQQRFKPISQRGKIKFAAHESHLVQTHFEEIAGKRDQLFL